MNGRPAQRRSIVIAVLREHRVKVEPEPDREHYFEVHRGTFSEVMRLPDLVHYPTIERFQWVLGIAVSKFYPPRLTKPKRRPRPSN